MFFLGVKVYYVHRQLHCSMDAGFGGKYNCFFRGGAKFFTTFFVKKNTWKKF